MNTYTIWRGTTPTLMIDCNFSTSIVTAVRICVRQGGTKIIKTLEDCTLNGQEISFDLTEEEMNRLSEGSAQIQARVLLWNGKITPTEQINVSVKNCTDYEPMAGDGV